MFSAINPLFSLHPIRLLSLAIAIASILAVLIAVLFFQKTLGLSPCPLCITQRLFVMSIGFTALLAFVHMPGPGFHRIYSIIGLVLSIGGAGVAARHVWLQHLPEHLVPACGPGLSYMFETMPFLEALKVLFQGDGDCADISWSLMGISIPGWTFLLFSVLAFLNAAQLFYTKQLTKSDSYV